MRWWVKWLVIPAAAVAVFMVLAVTAFTVWYGRPKAYSIPSCAMAPTLRIGDRLIASTRLGTIERGDIVVHELPAERQRPGVETVVKRVVASGGETVEIKDGRLWINGKTVDEDCLDSPPHMAFPLAPTTVPEGSYFMLGDNRNQSADSRVYGPITRGDIVAKKVFILDRSKGGAC